MGTKKNKSNQNANELILGCVFVCVYDKKKSDSSGSNECCKGHVCMYVYPLPHCIVYNIISLLRYDITNTFQKKDPAAV